MSRKKYYMILDVETANSTDDALVYDIGYTIVDRKGKVYEEKSYVIYDIFVLEKELMQSAYYAEKIPLYEEKLKEGKAVMKNLQTVMWEIRKKIKDYKITKVGAYNASFDYRALNTTLRYTTKSKYRYFLPYGVQMFCIWHMACQLIMTQKYYFHFAETHNLFSEKGNLITNAEVCYRYLIGDINFEEEHTGLEDVKIEREIFNRILRQKKKVDWDINRTCWRIPTKKYRELKGE